MPTYANSATNVIQFAPETTEGTYETPTIIWDGVFGDIQDDVDIRHIGREHQTGIIVPIASSLTTSKRASLAIPETEFNTLQAFHVFEGAIENVNAVDEGAGSGPYSRTYNYPGDGSVNSIKTYSFLTGSSTISKDVRSMAHGFVESFTLSGSYGEPWTISSNWIGAQVVNQASTETIAQPTGVYLPFNLTSLAIDDSGQTFGNTSVTGVLMSASVTINSGWVAVPVGDGNLYYTAIKMTRPSITFSLTLELEDTSIVEDERAHWLAEDVRLIRLDCQKNSDHGLTLDLTGKYNTFGAYADDNGNTTVTVEGECFYSATDSSYFEAVILNTVS